MKLIYWTWVAVLFLAAPVQAASWKATETIEYYTISGSTGSALYKSIGQKGPVISGNRRTIALTNWDLRWRRDYQPKGDGCTLVSALPFVKITYTLPKPSEKLSGLTAQRWKIFADGIAAHERHHGTLIKALTSRIIDETVGLHVSNDKSCKKIRAVVLDRVAASFAAYKAENSAFEKSEMSSGGNIRKLVHALILP